MLAERKAREEAERRAKEEVDRRTEAEARAAREAVRRTSDAKRSSKKTAQKAALSKGLKSAAQRPAVQKPAASKPRANGNGNGTPRPTLDEWGLYDPAKAGFGALYAKLEEIEESESLDEADALDATDEAMPAIPLAGRNPRPLSMWAWRTAAEPTPTQEKAPKGLAPDEFRGLVARLKIPPAIAAVRYATGARIRRVRVTPAARKAKRDGAQVIILSRKLLNQVRQQAVPGSLTDRR